jgi:hypothetical protein
MDEDLPVGPRLARQHRKRRIAAQLLVVVEAFVAQSHAQDVLRQQGQKPMFDSIRGPLVGKATGQPIQQVDLAIRPAQQQRASVTGNLTTGETGLDPAAKIGYKRERFLASVTERASMVWKLLLNKAVMPHNRKAKGDLRALPGWQSEFDIYGSRSLFRLQWMTAASMPTKTR